MVGRMSHIILELIWLDISKGVLVDVASTDSDTAVEVRACSNSLEGVSY